MATQRLKWIDEGYRTVSACGRFTIGVTFHGNATYHLLTDTARDAEHLCRTLDGAKASARSIAQGRYETVQTCLAEWVNERATEWSDAELTHRESAYARMALPAESAICRAELSRRFSKVG